MGRKELKPTNYAALMDDVTYKNMVVQNKSFSGYRGNG